MTQKQKNVLTELKDGLFYKMKQFTFDKEKHDKEDLKERF